MIDAATARQPVLAQSAQSTEPSIWAEKNLILRPYEEPYYYARIVDLSLTAMPQRLWFCNPSTMILVDADGTPVDMGITPVDMDITVDRSLDDPLLYLERLDTNLGRFHPAIHDFSMGLGGVQPDFAAIATASCIAEAAWAMTIEPEITLDVDGALSFDLRLTNGLLMLAELDPQGELDASVYDDSQGVLVQRLSPATASEIIRWF